MSKKRILVTGGAGFLGSHLCGRLIGQGNEVVCLDNFSTGSEHNIASLLGEPSFRLLRQDILDPVVVDVDQIYNLACPASPKQYQANPIATLKANVIGALNVLDLARRLDIPVLQASTSEVYGDPHIHPQPEEYWGNVNPIGPRSCYDEGKRCAETLFFDYHRQYGVDIRVARIFNTYGPRMHPDDGRVVSNFILQALRDEPITLFGDGSQTRSLCYVDDMIAGLSALMDGGPNTGPVNLGNPEELSMRQLADVIVELTNSRSPILHRPLPVDDPRQRRPDTTRAGITLGWAASVPLREGLSRTIDYFAAIVTEAA